MTVVRDGRGSANGVARFGRPSALARVGVACGFLALVGPTACDSSLAKELKTVEDRLTKTASGAELEGDPVRAGSPVPARAGALAEALPVADSDPVPREHEPRAYAKTRFIWIREEPSWSSPWLGYLWIGGSVALANPRPIYARGCDRWYEVRPRGYVCVDGTRATLDASDPEYVAVSAHAPDLSSTAPHRYAESLGAPRYATLPTREEQRAREPDLVQHEALIERAESGGARDATLEGVDLAPASTDAVAFANLPPYVQVQRNFLRRDSTIAYSGEYRYGGRSWLLTGDLAWVPKDRVRPYDPSTFHGFAVTDPHVRVAFFREHDRPAFRRSPSGEWVRDERDFPRLGTAKLTGTEATHGNATYLETADGRWVLASDAVVPAPSERTPWGTRVGGPDIGRDRPAGRATWIEMSIYGGWLIAYEGSRPVFATLASSGRGGAARGTEDPVETASTPVGRFNVNGKFVTATMDAPEGVTHSDVPWVQNFSGPHAIHAAYWHDAWGERVSGGCLNVSLPDARWLFDFSEPKLPDGWHGVRWDRKVGATTIVVIHG